MRRQVLNPILMALALSGIAAAPPAAPAAVSTCFSPGPISCAEEIADRIDAARASVRVQAYYLTQPLILRALASARRRGVDVQAILDKSQDRRDSPRSHYTGATYLAHAGVPVWIDDAPAIAHSKVVILDSRTVVTGSFNFTKAADKKNAENVVFIDSPAIAMQFGQNWEERRAASRPFEAE